MTQKELEELRSRADDVVQIIERGGDLDELERAILDLRLSLQDAQLKKPSPRSPRKGLHVVKYGAVDDWKLMGGEYCAKCGESEDSGTHLFNHSFERHER